jgi:hypothetical protein
MNLHWVYPNYITIYEILWDMIMNIKILKMIPYYFQYSVLISIRHMDSISIIYYLFHISFTIYMLITMALL